MLSVDEMEYHPTSEKLVEILCGKTQNNNPLFFRVLVGYYFNVMASMMRTQIATHDRGDIPINMYALNLSTSGSGKGFSTNIMENNVIQLFRQRFLDETFPTLADQALPKLALARAYKKGLPDAEEEEVRVRKEFEGLGTLVFNFDSGTPAAVKQMRHKLLMADAGAMCLQIDEIGSNLLGQIDVLTTFLELFDVGLIKQKLLKNTAENTRNEEIIGRTPTNMLLFGTPAKLLNGGKNEEELYSMLETGYARRCFFGYSRASQVGNDLTPEQVYDLMTNKDSNAFLNELADRFYNLADVVKVNGKLQMTKETSLLVIEYKLKCEREAAQYPEHEEIKKAEISHRYFKALKLAGAYAFIDESPEVTTAHLYNAIKLAEESGDAFNRLLTRDRNYVKLARYIGAVGKDITQADLVEDLPFYRGSASQKAEMMSLAIAWGYKNNFILKKSFSDGIEFFRGETLKPTDLNKLVISASQDIAENYDNTYAPWDKLYRLTQAYPYHWTNHHMMGGNREEGNAIPGFNLLVLDVDKGTSLNQVRTLLKDYKYLIYTTKRHTDDENRFRVIMPLNYTLSLDAKDYKEFISNIFEWLPFDVDTATNQRARKWLSCTGHYEYNEGEMLNVLPFIPKTSKNEERKVLLDSQHSMDNLERWVINNIGDGNRNNMLHRFGMILIDGGMDLDVVRQKVLELNSKIPDKLEEMEILSTIMISLAKAHGNRP